MTNPDAIEPQRHLTDGDLVAALGTVIAVYGDLTGGKLDQQQVRHLYRRLIRAGLIDESATIRDLRQAYDDLIQRLRYALGEYEEAPSPTPVFPTEVDNTQLATPE